MLYDPKWEQEIKADPFMLSSLIAWLKRQPAHERYKFANCEGQCLFSQYLRWALGSHRFGDGSYAEFCCHVPQAIAAGWPRTFGAALARARALSR